MAAVATLPSSFTVGWYTGSAPAGTKVGAGRGLCWLPVHYFGLTSMLGVLPLSGLDFALILER